MESRSADGAPHIAVVYPKLTFKKPVALTSTKDGRIFVVEQDGVIRIFRKSGDVAAASVFLDISSTVLSAADDGGGFEEGLLGLAFDPGFATNGVFYVYYSAASPRRNVLAGYRVSASNPDVADPASARIMLELPKPFSNHNGGTIAFGPDGKLYVAVGDGGSAGDPQGNGQDKSRLLGKILRIDPNAGEPYGVPPDNPFVSEPGARGEIWAFGMRNPWKFSFDRKTGDLWLGDAGQNSVEEIDLVRKGDNLGWNVFEGDREFENPGQLPASQFRMPVLVYPNDETGGRAVIGGFVYRGSAQEALAGKYLYGDYVSGRVWALRHSNGAVASNDEIGRVPNLSAFGEDPDGEILMLSLDSGKVYGFTSS